MMDRRAWQMLMIGLGTALVPLDSAVNIAFPAITARFGLAIQDIQWVVICYLLTYISLLLAVGRIGDLFGHALVFRIGLVWSAGALLLSALAPSYPALLACRVLQGVGAALVLSCGPALSTGLYDEERRSRVLGVYTMCWALGMALGPWIGGALVQAWGWPAVFWFRVPIAILALVLLRDLPRMPRHTGPASFDFLGAGLLALALLALLMSFNRLGHWLVLPLGFLSLAAFLGFFWQERRASQPILDLRMFSAPGFARLNVAYLLTNLAGFTVWLLVPYYLTRETGLTLTAAGAVLATGSFGMTAAALAGGRLIGRITAGRLTVIGALLTGIGLAATSTWAPGTATPFLIGALLVQGFGIGLFQVAYTDLVAAAMPRESRGVAGSLAMLTRTIGTVSAAALLLLLFQRLAADSGFLPAFRQSFQLAAVLPLAMAGVLALRPRR